MLGLLKRILTYILIIFISVACFLIVFRVPAAIFAIFAALALVLVSRIGNRGFIILIVLGSFLIRFAYIIIIDTPLDSDFKLLYDAAVLFSRGDYSFSGQVYFQEWAYQTGFVIYQGLVIRVFGEAGGIIALKILNCLWNTGITLIIYLIARNFFGEKSSRMAAVLYSGFVFPVTFVSVLSNQHISTFFMLLGLFFILDQRLIRMRQLPRSLIAGFLLALGNVMRPEAIIIIVSLMVYYLVLFLRAGDMRQRMKRVMQYLAVLIVYLAVNGLASYAISESGVNPQGLRNNNAWWKVVVGLNYDSRGGYNDHDYQLVYGGNKSLEERKELEKDLIRERLGMNSLKLANLFLKKIQNMWCENALDWSYKHILESNRVITLFYNPVRFSDIDAVLKDLNELFIYASMILSLLGMLAWRKSQMDDGLLIPVAILAASFVIYLLIEVQPRYAYMQQPFLFILSGAGLDILYRGFDGFSLKRAWTRLRNSVSHGSGQQ